MNCRNCSTLINYNYLTDCPQCGCAVEGAELPALLPPTAATKKERAWRSSLTNLIYVLLASVTGMISGAVVLNLSCAALYNALASPETYPGQHCGRGMALAMLTALLGGFLGTVGGTAFSVKNPLLNRRSN